MTVTTTTSTRTRRPRPKLVTLTDAAAARVREILDERGQGFLRVGVTNGGCAGMEYVMDYVSEIEKFDEVVEDKDVQIVVDAKAVLFILCLLYTSPSPRDATLSRMPSSA